MAGTSLPPQQKAAALMLAIGSSKASAVLEHLSREEIEALAAEVGRLGDIDPPQRMTVIRETVRHLNDIDPATEAAALRARARALPGGSDDHVTGVAPFDILQHVELEQSVQYLKGEHPQTVALILANQPPGLASTILGQFDPDEANDIAYRIATLGRTAPEVIKRIEKALHENLTEATQAEQLGPDGAKGLAAILNNADRDAEDTILEYLGGVDTELAEYVRALMFVFEDVATLDDRTIQQVLQAVQTSTLALALKGAEDGVSDALLRNLSERAREGLLEEIDLLGPVRRADVDQARSQIVAEIRALEASGQIVISRGGEGDLIE